MKTRGFLFLLFFLLANGWPCAVYADFYDWLGRVCNVCEENATSFSRWMYEKAITDQRCTSGMPREFYSDQVPKVLAACGDPSAIKKLNDASQTMSQATYQELEQSTLKNALLGRVTDHWNEENKCERNYLGLFNKDVTSELKDFCEYRKKSDSLLSTPNLSSQAKNQILLAQDLAKKISSMRQYIEIFKAGGFAPGLENGLIDGSYQVPSPETWKSNYVPEKCPVGIQKTAKEAHACAYAAALAFSTTKQMSWMSQHPQMANLLNRYITGSTRFNGDNKESVMWGLLCSNYPREEVSERRSVLPPNRDSLYSAFLGEAGRKAEEDRGYLQRVQGKNFAQNPWFENMAYSRGRITSELATMDPRLKPVHLVGKNGKSVDGVYLGQTPDNVAIESSASVRCEKPVTLLGRQACLLKKSDFQNSSIPGDPNTMFMDLLCDWDRKVGSGRDIAKQGVGIAMAVVPIGPSLLKGAGQIALKSFTLLFEGTEVATTAFELAGVASKLAQAAKAGRMALIAKSASLAFSAASLVPQYVDTVDTCFGPNSADLQSISCERAVSATESPEAVYKDIEKGNCALQAALAGLGTFATAVQAKGVVNEFRGVRPTNPSAGTSEALDDAGRSRSRSTGSGGSSSAATAESELAETLPAKNEGTHPIWNKVDDIITNARASAAKALEVFKNRYQTFTRITKAQNEEFIQIVLGQAKKKAKMFFSAENSLLKEMNKDMLNDDKDLATALTNFYKELMSEAIASDPLLKTKIVAQYEDFKGVRFALSEDTPEIRAALQKLSDEVNQRFGQLAKSKLLEGPMSRAKLTGLRGDPVNWFQTAAGHTADEAGAAARKGKKLTQSGQVRTTFYEDVEAMIADDAIKAEAIRSRTIQTLEADSGLVVESTTARNGIKFKALSADAVDIFRKADPPDTIPDLAKRFTARFGKPYGSARLSEEDARYYFDLAQKFEERFKVKLSLTQLTDMKKYLDAADSFSPQLLVASRELPDISTSTTGVLGTDFAGMGSIDRSHMLTRLAGITDPKQALLAARQAEREVTNGAIASRRTFVGRLMDEVSKRRGFSGDDGQAIPDREISSQTFSDYVHSFTKEEAPDRASAYRPTLVRPRTVAGTPVPGSELTQWQAHAEAVEKELRQQLVKKLSRQQFDSTVIGVEIVPAQKTATDAIAGSQVTIHIGNPKLTASELQDVRKAIIDLFKRENLKPIRDCFMTNTLTSGCVSLKPPLGAGLYGPSTLYLSALWEAPNSSLAPVIPILPKKLRLMSAMSLATP